MSPLDDLGKEERRKSGLERRNLRLEEERLKQELEQKAEERRALEEKKEKYKRLLTNKDIVEHKWNPQNWFKPLEPETHDKPSAFRHEEINLEAQIKARQELEENLLSKEQLQEKLKKHQKALDQNIQDSREIASSLQNIQQQLRDLDNLSLPSPSQGRSRSPREERTSRENPQERSPRSSPSHAREGARRVMEALTESVPSFPKPKASPKLAPIVNPQEPRSPSTRQNRSNISVDVLKQSLEATEPMKRVPTSSSSGSVPILSPLARNTKSSKGTSII